MLKKTDLTSDRIPGIEFLRSYLAYWIITMGSLPSYITVYLAGFSNCIQTSSNFVTISKKTTKEAGYISIQDTEQFENEDEDLIADD